MQRRSLDGKLIFDYQRSSGQGVTMLRIICARCKHTTRFYVWESRALLESANHDCTKPLVMSL